jgi:hypothetical protein
VWSFCQCWLDFLVCFILPVFLPVRTGRNSKVTLAIDKIIIHQIVEQAPQCFYVGHELPRCRSYFVPLGIQSALQMQIKAFEERVFHLIARIP